MRIVMLHKIRRANNFQFYSKLCLQNGLSLYIPQLMCNFCFSLCVYETSLHLSQIFSCLQMGNKEKSESLNRAIDNMGRKTRDLRRQLRKAVVDHVSDRQVILVVLGSGDYTTILSPLLTFLFNLYCSQYTQKLQSSSI